MSNYQNFLYDFPDRCQQLLKHIENQKTLKKRLDVTAYLALFGYSALVVHEVIGKKNPLQSTRNNEELFSKQYDELMNSYFFETSFCQYDKKEDWKFVNNFRLKKNSLDSSIKLSQLEWKKLSCAKKVKGILDIIRNSLAHANTYMDGSQSINRINFISLRSGIDQIKDPCNEELKVDILSCSVESFKYLGLKWFEFIAKHSQRQFLDFTIYP